VSFLKTLKFLLTKGIHRIRRKRLRTERREKQGIEKSQKSGNDYPAFLGPYLSDYEPAENMGEADKVVMARKIQTRFGKVYTCFCDFDEFDEGNMPVPLVPTVCTIKVCPMSCEIFIFKRRDKK